MRYFIFTFSILLFSLSSFSKTVISTQNGNWKDYHTWGGSSNADLPVNGDIVIIRHNVILDKNIDISSGSLTIEAGASLIKDANNRNINCYDASGVLTNHGTLEFWNHDGEGEIHNYGTMTVMNSVNSLYNSGKLYNYSGATLTVTSIFNMWTNCTFINWGTVVQTNNSAFNYEGPGIENYGYLEVNSIDQGYDILNTGTLMVRNNFELWLSPTFTNNGTVEIGGNVTLNSQNSIIENDGTITIAGKTIIYGKIFNDGSINVVGNNSIEGELENNGEYYTTGNFQNNGATITNNGAIYVLGSSNFLNNNWSGTVLKTTSCGHINVGCNTFIHRASANVSGNMNITAGSFSGTGGYDASVTFNAQNPCSNNPVTYISIADGNWDDYNDCSSGTNVWSTTKFYPNPIYEYPKYYGNVIIDGHTIEIDASCDQPLDCDSLTLAPEGNLTIDATKTLSVNEDFIIESPENSGATGSLIDNGTINITGTKTVQRYITGNNWHYIGFPVDEVDGSSFFQPNFYFYNEDNNDTWNADDIYGVSGWEPAGTGILTTAMRGYIYYYEDNMLEFTGDLNTGNQSIELSYTNNNPSQPEFDGWNLVCNPYPSAIDWESVTTTNIIDNCIYFYDDDGSSPYFNNYRYYIKGGGSNPYPSISVNGGQQYVPVAQGFFVRTTTDGQTFSLDNSVRTHSSQSFYKKEAETKTEIEYIKLNVSGNLGIDETAIRFIEESTELFDGQFDAIKMFSYSGDNPNLYSYTENNENLAINTLPTYENKIVKLGFNAKQSGSYQIVATELDFFKTDNVLLYDNIEQIYQNLLINPVYVFESDSGSFENRFQLFFQPITKIKELGNNIEIYSNKNIIYISQNSIENSNLNIKVFSIDGRVNNQTQTNSNNTEIEVFQSGVYIVFIEAENYTISKKVVVFAE